MSTLTGQQIKDTYDGLLKLADSTAGITPNLQAVQDGLGNNTGARIATNYFTAPNVVNLNGNLIPDYAGTGCLASPGTAFQANSQNRVVYNIFYDMGVYSYSAFTYYLGTLTSTSDIVNVSFYSLQLVPTIGVAPKDLIMSGITLESSTSTGLKTTALPSTLSFSGTGGGFYVMAIYISNAGVTPTVRYGGPAQATNRSNSFYDSLGFYMNAAGTQIVNGSKLSSNFVTGNGFVINNLPQQTTYTELDIINNFASTATQGYFGFALNVIR